MTQIEISCNTLRI